MAKPLSNMVSVPPPDGKGRGAAAEGPGLWAAAGEGTREDGLPDVGGCGGAGARTAEGAAAAAVAKLGGGAPGASVGNLMVGADVGFGGKLIRTVSFLG
jgi:hypothetical protein